MKIYLKIVLINLLPSIFIFLGKNEYLFNYFKTEELFWFNQNTEIEPIQTCFFFIGILWVGLIFPFRYAYIQKRQKKQNEIFSELINYNKKILFKFPQIKYKSLNIKFNTRIFVPKKGIWEFFKDGTTLVPKHYDGLTDKLENRKLSFKVNDKIAEGMVGKSFKEEDVFIDFDMSNQNKYNLTKNQKRFVRDAKFCSTIPILDNNNKPIAVLSVDSEKKVRKTDNIKDTWTEHLIEYASFITKNIKI
ncbi:hypothetical protein RQM65_09295 [Pricia sp. S334]|uniref:GAF domain-containing protein n=1 Tax=Pricia mediterranea TaxID=3076079 RepID=A0ABU3L6A2_9FLAO|nr:hypothetical protein [Pricia sp. S334]MDT7828856.1 hypothetical protein [Pricia sp. S334]